MKTLVLAIGNSILRDEGIGLHVLSALQKEHTFPPEITLLDGGTLSFTLASAVSEADKLIVIDAAQLNSTPGTIKIFKNNAMDDFLGACKRSVHEIGLLDLFDIARLTETLPAERALIGIQPKSIDWGDMLSPELESVMPRAVQTVLELIGSDFGTADERDLEAVA